MILAATVGRVDDSSAPRASVVVCTRDRPESMLRCLRSIVEDVSHTPWDVEIVVVDNGALAGSRPFSVPSEFDEMASVRVVVEPVPGLSAARNRGVEASSGAIIAFTDDDVSVRPGWVEALVEGFRDSSVGAIGGRVLPLWDGCKPGWIVGEHSEIIELRDLGLTPHSCAAERLPYGANLAFRRSALSEVTPPFHPSLGHTDGVGFAGEEVFALERLLELGWSVDYQPAAVVDHHILAARLGYAAVAAKYFACGLGVTRRERLHGTPRTESRMRAAARALRARRRLLRLRNRTDGSSVALKAQKEMREFLWMGRTVGSAIGGVPWLEAWTAHRWVPKSLEPPPGPSREDGGRSARSRGVRRLR
ncbi:MAG: glycosyltransferase [Herbiconiux sp.]|nr:glycosyltransferase [Herbiconiux sp.]